MSTFTSRSTNDEIPKAGFSVYDPLVTESYRVSCVRNLVRHILRGKSGEDRAPSAFEVFGSVRRECRNLLETANSDGSYMYSSIPDDKRNLFIRENTCVVHEPVSVIEEEEEEEGTETGLFSNFTANISPRPLVHTVELSGEKEVLSFHELVNLSTISYDGKKLALGAALPCNAEKMETGKTLPLEESNAMKPPCQPGKLRRTKKIEETMEIADADTLVEDFDNIFVYLAVRLREGHLLRKPTYLLYKNSSFAFRLRLRCRLYDPPPQWDQSKEYQRCPARLYARLFKEGGWRLTFRHNHNHRIWSQARLGGTEIRKRLSALRSSLETYYPGGKEEYRTWIAGVRFAGTFCPAKDGSWLSSCFRQEQCSTPSECENKSGTEEQQPDKAEIPYIDIAHRPLLRSETNVEVVVPVNRLSIGESNIGDREVEELFPISVEVQDTLSKFVQGCLVTMDGVDLKEEIKHLSECFGFPMVVRSSKYYYDETTNSQPGPPQVQRLVFKCVIGNDTKLRRPCHYQFTILTSARAYVKPSDLGDTDKGEHEYLSRPFVVKFSEKWHSHTENVECLRKCLPPEIWNEAVHMRDKSLISSADIVRHLEDKYNFHLDRKTLARRLRWEMRKRHPAERDCQRLVSNLFSISRRYPGMFVEARVVDDNALHSVCWGFPEWLEEYKQFGIIPGVGVDAKALANNFDTPLAIIGGRTNNGKLAIYFMGFLASQREEEFAWFLKQFREFVGVPPLLLSCDQDAAIINAAEKVLPTSLVILDDWHLNNNQMKRLKGYGAKESDADLGSRMNSALHALRRSPSEVLFLRNRRNFEEEYFTDGELPQWYKTLFYSYSKHVVLGFNRTTCGLRFLYQGSGYVESVNAQYKRIIMERNAPMSRIPEEMLRYTEDKLRERKQELRAKRFTEPITFTSVAQFGFDEATWERVVQRLVPYALNEFFNTSVRGTHKYTVPKCEESVHPLYGEVYCFVVTAEDYDMRAYRVFSPKEYDEDSYFAQMCSCHWSRSTGLPCRHAVRVSTLFNQLPSTSGRFPLECMFHPYWRKDKKGWSYGDIVRARFGDRHATAGEQDEETAPRDEKTETARLDRLRTVLWCNGHSTWNQIHQRVSKKGIVAMRKLDRMMTLLLQEVTRNKEKDDLDIALLTRRVKEQVETECGSSSFPKKLDMEDAIAIESVKNSSVGKVKGRGTKKRARSWTENKAGKKRKRIYFSHNR